MTRRFKTPIGGVSSVALLIIVWAFWVEPASFRVREHKLPIGGWPAEANGLRIALLSDLHVGSPFNGLDKLNAIVEATNEAAPDLVLIAGDFVIHGVLGGQFVAPKLIAESLSELEAPLGIFAVLGNHDWWFDGEQVREALVDVGIPVLEDESIKLREGNFEFWLTGVSDFWEGDPDVRNALQNVPRDATIVLFTHNPDIFPEVPDHVTLMLAGHTHGGQVWLPVIGYPIVPSKFGQRFVEGHITEGRRQYFVTRGIGTSMLPVRFLVPPEVSILRLRSLK